MHAGELFCDLAKTFDCAYHEILPSKLYVFGNQGTAASCFDWILSNIYIIYIKD
jgi:hypothetical protein